jgi:hypothetical protein
MTSLVPTLKKRKKNIPSFWVGNLFEPWLDITAPYLLGTDLDSCKKQLLFLAQNGFNTKVL